METHSHENKLSQENRAQNEEFTSGAAVIYGLHGRCSITGIEARNIGGRLIRFYKLEIQRSSLSRSSRQEPAIWVPISDAAAKGLRAPLSAENVEPVMAILSSREYYFDINETWSTVFPKLETTIRTEGAIGLAKVVSYLFVLKKKLLVPSSEIMKFSETVNKLLFREIAEATGGQAKALEDQAQKIMRPKLLPNQ